MSEEDAVRRYFSAIHTDDRVVVRVSRPGVLDVGDHNLVVIESTDHSFAVDVWGPWWFRRDNGTAYIGAAQVLPWPRCGADGLPLDGEPLPQATVV